MVLPLFLAISIITITASNKPSRDGGEMLSFRKKLLP
jgi:hypothetical protein